MDRVLGLDFGTTNSLAAVVVGDQVLSLVDEVSGRPHPSVIWYRGGKPVVGREARKNMDLTEGGAPPGFVRSPKIALRRGGSIYVDGNPIDPTDAVAEVLRHLRDDAKISREGSPSHDLSWAVFTIPVAFGGPERRAIRRAARKAGIAITQFVHEPVAAIYAHIRSQKDMRRELSRMEGHSVLVFDWGGGTLDLTICKIIRGTILQVASLGDDEVGGDRFDERLRNFLRYKHAEKHDIADTTALEQPGMAAKLLLQCELAKISLSSPAIDSEDIIVRDFLKIDSGAENLIGSITRTDLEAESRDIVNCGLSRIDEILEQARLSYEDIELCLATGGMVNMPAIRNGLTERFLGRVPLLENGDRIIAEGAAWIAHDELRLKLSKPIEILVADTSGRGTYYPLVNTGWVLPMENQIQKVTNTRLFCTDPREGVAVVELSKPVKIGQTFPTDARKTLCVIDVLVDSEAEPLLERIECDLQIDHDYVVKVRLRSTGRGGAAEAEFHDLDFALALPDIENDTEASSEGDEPEVASHSKGNLGSKTGNLYQRTNVTTLDDTSRGKDALWRTVPGDLVQQWRLTHFDTRTQGATPRQREEKMFYEPCVRCGRRISEIKAVGRISDCDSSCHIPDRV